jgi:spore maturation protein CgeB
MKILLVTCRNPHFPTITEYVEEALRAEGCTVGFFDDRGFLLPGRIRDALPLLKEADLRRLNLRLVQKALFLRPDMLLVMGGTRVLAETVERVRAAGIKTVLWTIDPPTLSRKFRRLCQATKHYDFIFCGGTEALEVLDLGGSPKARWLPFGFAAGYHQPVRGAGGDPEFDVCFIGSYYPKRERDFAGLSEFRLRIWGPGWEKLAPSSPLRLLTTPGHFPPGSWMKAYCEAKIVLCAHYQDGTNPCYQASPRVFEALAMGAFLLCDDQKDVRALFEDGRHLVIYRDSRDLREKVAYYLSHPEERRRIAAQGQQAALAGHSYSHRVRVLLEAVKAIDKAGRAV